MIKHGKFLAIIVSLLILQIGCSSRQPRVIGVNYPPFIDAARRGDITEIEELLKNGETPMQTSIGNQTALHVAAAEGEDDMVKWLLAHEADPFAQDLNGKTPADFARDQGNTSTVIILEEYMQLLQESFDARLNGDAERLAELLSEDYRQYTPLHVFARDGGVNDVQAEIEAGADVDARSKMEWTPLHAATVGEQAVVASILLQNGADVNAVDVWNNPPIYYAILLENAQLVELYLNAGADLSYRSAFENETIIEYAERIGNLDILVLLKNR